MSEQNEQVCDAGPTLLFACSGAADVGAVSDQAARRLSAAGDAQMFCLAGLGGRIEPIITKTKAASRIVALDGCQLACAKACLAEAGFSECSHVCVTQLGFEKGNTPVNEAAVQQVVDKVHAVLNA